MGDEQFRLLVNWFLTALFLLCALPVVLLLLWAAATGRDVAILEKTRLADPRRFRRMVLTGRVNGAMVTLACFVALFVPFGADEGISAAIVIWPICVPMLLLFFHWTRLAWKTSL